MWGTAFCVRLKDEVRANDKRDNRDNADMDLRIHTGSAPPLV